MLAPGGLYVLEAPWKELYVRCQSTLWVLMGVFLVLAAQERPAVAQSGVQV